MLKLLHNDTLIGTISNAEPDELAMVGSIELTSDAEKFGDLFRFLSDEANVSEDPPFGEELLEGWQIENENGERLDIFTPTVYPDGLICWR